jgi:hypothetical protein
MPMSDDPWIRLKILPCKHLRSKEMFYDTGTPLEERSGSGIFWCEHTQRCLGPDDSPVSREECVPQRGCYE